MGKKYRNQSPPPRPTDTNKDSQEPQICNLPYNFQARPNTPKKELQEEKHHCLSDGRFDVAFEVTWKTLTPVAANPCLDGTVSSSNPENMAEGEFGGNGRRWLMQQNRPAISPFTVKSAVADGFAAIMGGCYRIINDEIGHSDDISDGSYPYTGVWKRYRVDKAKSNPAIVEQVDTSNGEVTLHLVEEYYYNTKEVNFTKGQTYHVDFTNKFAKIIKNISSDKPFPGSIPLIYHGPYRFGMNNELAGGDLKTKTYHRFYKTTGRKLTGNVPKECFYSVEELKKRVYMGSTKTMTPGDEREQGRPWYDDLRELKPGDWVYYQAFQGKVVAIGKNFQFKALFNHQHAIPEGQKACSSLDALCPRCRMFGLAVNDDAQNVVGFRGRFKSSTLLCDTPLLPQIVKESIPTEEGVKSVSICEWQDDKGEPLARQVLLPILGQPKANKRDISAYFDDKGQISGSKIYRHCSQGLSNNLRDLQKFCDTATGEAAGKNLAPSHKMRGWAQVCNKGLEFHGTLGAENCSEEELAALIFLLERRISNHGFKIGLGKAFGLGTMASKIRAIWIRDASEYAWKRIDLHQFTKTKQFEKELKTLTPNMEACLDKLDTKTTTNTLGQMKDTKSGYHGPDKYWQNALA